MPNRGKASHAAALRVLIIDADKVDFVGISRLLRNAPDGPFNVEWEPDPSAGLDKMLSGDFDVYLLDHLLDKHHQPGLLDTAIRSRIRQPVIILTGVDEKEQAGLEAIRRGAADYLVKGVGGGALLARSIRYSIERKRAEERLSFLSHHDALTGLANRHLFYSTLKEATLRADRHGKPVGLLYIDIDDFKPINDNHGHEAGDKVIVAVGAVLLQQVREVDIVARMGGDEFAIILDDITGAQDAVNVAERIIDALSQPVMFYETPLQAFPSIGIALYPTHSTDRGEALVARADRTMYEAKATKGGSFAISPFLREVAGTSRHAHPDWELTQEPLAYNPGTTQHSFFRTPDELADPDLCEAVLKVIKHRRAETRDVTESWLAMRPENIRPGFTEMFCEKLRDHGMVAEHLGLALPCGFALEPTPARVEMLHELSAAGIRLALTDFDGSIRSLASLASLPPMVLVELEPGLADFVTRGAEHRELVRCLLSSIRAMGSLPGASGVGLSACQNKLTEMGCAYIRGPAVGPRIHLEPRSVAA